MENNLIKYENITYGRKFNDMGQVIKEYHKISNDSQNIKEIIECKIGIDANILIQAIINKTFRQLLKDNIGKDFPYTNNKFKNETINVLCYKYKYEQNKSIEEFRKLELELKIGLLNVEVEDITKGLQLRDNILKSGIKIRKKANFLIDCIGVMNFVRNGITDFFCNDEDLIKGCKNQKIQLNFISLAPSNEKIIKEFFRSYRFKKKR